MKRFFNYLSIAVVAASTLVACSKFESPVKEQEGVKTISFSASSLDTKSYFGDKETEGYPTIWTADQQVKIAVVNINPVKVADADVTPSADGRSATFAADFSFDGYDDDDDLEFVSVSPACAVDEVSNFGCMVASVPSTQTPTMNSVDQKAHIMGATNTSYSVGTLPSSVKLNFTHQVAYGKFMLKGFPEDVTISSIELESTEDIVGQFTYPAVPESIIGSMSRGKKLTINASGISAESNNSMVFWFAILPVDLGGKTVKVTVNTSDGPYEKNITFPSGKKFEAGKVASFKIDMTGIVREWDATIQFGNSGTKITSANATGTDNLGNTWTITTAQPSYFYNASNFSRIGDEGYPVESITFTTTLHRTSKITGMTVKFSGTDSAKGDIALKVDGISKKTGSLDGDFDVVLSATPGVSGTVLTVTVTNIDAWGGNGGVEAYYINVKYEN